MKSIMKTIAAAVRRMMAGMARVALVSVRTAAGAIDWIWTVLQPSPVEPFVAEPEVLEIAAPATAFEVDEVALHEVGDEVLLAARAVAAGREVPGTVDPVLARWVRCLDRDDVWTLLRAAAVAVGRHVAGLETIVDPEGRTLRRPEPDADLERDAARVRREAGRRDEVLAEKAAARRRVAEKRELETAAMRPDWSAALAPVPQLTP